MLSENSTYVAGKIVTQLNEHKISLAAKVGSPIAMLSDGITAIANSALPADNYAELLHADSVTYGRNENNNASLHDEKMEWVVKCVHRGVTADLNMAKNVIIPVIEQTMDDVEAAIKGSVSDACHGFQIVPQAACELLLDQKIENLFERYESVTPRPFNPLLAFPEMEGTELAKFIKTGDDEINTLLEATISDRSIADLDLIYRLHFTDHGYREVNPDSMSGIEAALIYFLSIGLEANLPDGVNASLSGIKLALATLRSMTGARVFREIRANARRVEQKELITSVEGYGNDRKIFVNKTVYDQFLDAGGSPEAIFGAIVSKSSLDFNGILNRRVKLTEAWNSTLENIRAKNDVNKLDIVIGALRKSLSTQLSEMEDLPKGSGSRGDIERRISAETRNFYLTDLDNYNNSVKRVVINAIFPEQHNARFIIDSIDKQVCEEGEERKLAARVTMSLIADWLVQNLEISKHE